MDNISINPIVKELVLACIEEIEADSPKMYVWGKHIRNKVGGKVRLLGRIATPVFTKQIETDDASSDLFSVSPLDLLVWMSVMGFGTTKLLNKINKAYLRSTKVGGIV